ncbi:MAG: hypothetical protein PHU34_00905 [Candidatus Methanoperedens sp.]|nr:hypothetical protein [Candidatus Methanoperedens sp.]
MNRLIKITAVLLIVAMLALPVFAEKGDGMMRGKAAEMMKKGQDIRGAGGMMGMGFMHSAGNNYGNYVTFTVDNTTGEVSNYSISGIAIFDSIKVANFNFKDSKPQGSLTKITNKDGSVVLQLHDNPAAVINIKTKTATTITFNLAEGVKATKEDKVIKIEADNLTAFIAGTNATSINIAGDEIRIESSAGNAIFRAVPVNMPVSKGHGKFMAEMMKNRAGAEISVGAYGKYSIANYSEDTNVMIRSMDRNRMRMTINSTDPSGKFFMMNLDNSSLTWTERQKIRLYIDNKPMMQVMSEEELYNATVSSFWLTMHSGNRMQAMMYIANFSERTVDVTVEDAGAATPVETPSGTPEKTPAATPKTPGFGLAIGVAGAGIAYLRRKYQK